MISLARHLSVIAAAAILACIPTGAVAQADSIKPAIYTPEAKNPQSARTFATVMVGAGHMYAGEAGSGFVLLGSAVMGAVAGLRDPKAAPFGAVVTLGAWVLGILDADDAARRTNERMRRTAVVGRVAPALAIRSDAVFAGWQVAWRR